MISRYFTSKKQLMINYIFKKRKRKRIFGLMEIEVVVS